MKWYTFTIEISGQGDTPERAWDDACEIYLQQDLEMPDKYKIESEDE